MTDMNQLKSKIPGWGADLDPKNRSGVPREKTPPHETGAHWDEPERQIPRVKILKSSEHKTLTPVFGTSCPPKGLSGFIREYAYTLSEGKKSHWIFLLIADRVDVIEGLLESALRLRPHNPLKEMGLAAEFKGKGLRSRFGQHRADVKRMQKEAVVVLGLGLAFLIRESILRRSDKRRSDKQIPDRRKGERRKAA